MAAELHLAEDALALHLLLQHLESLVDIVVTDEYPHAAFLLDRAVDGRIRRYWAAAGFWSFWVGSLHEFVGWFLGRVPLSHPLSANLTIDAVTVSNGQFGIAHDVLCSAMWAAKVNVMVQSRAAHYYCIICALPPDRYCTSGIGDIAFDQVYGKDSMHRFVYHTRDSFFHVGRGRRDTLVKEYGRLDPRIADIVLDEMRANWWRHLLVSIPLGWCGMWVGWLWSLLLVPLFGWACVRAARQSQPLLLLYAAPAIVMLGLHAAVANQSTRYNLILIGPFSVGAAWIISATLRNARWRSRALAPGP